jgi:hypothetical protein
MSSRNFSEGRESSGEHYYSADDDSEHDELEAAEDISEESCQYVVPLNGTNLMSPRSGGAFNLSVLSSDDSDFGGVSPGVPLGESENKHNSLKRDLPGHKTTNRMHGMYAKEEEKTPMVTNRSFRMRRGLKMFHDDDDADDNPHHGIDDQVEKSGTFSFPSHLPVFRDSSEEESEERRNHADEEEDEPDNHSESIQEDEPDNHSESIQEEAPLPPLSPYGRVFSSLTAESGTMTPRRSRRNTSSTDYSELTSSPKTPGFSHQQELQRDRINHVMMTPAGLRTPEENEYEFRQKNENRGQEDLNHLIMTPEMSATRNLPFRPTSAFMIHRSPGATAAESLSYSTDQSRAQSRNRSGETENSTVSFASPGQSRNNRSTEKVSHQTQLGSILRASGHTGGSNNSNSLAGSTIQSETTRYHSGVEREFRKEAFKKNQSNREADDVENASSDGSASAMEPLIVCGITCPMWIASLSDKEYNLYRISLCIVEYAPCFWLWCCNKSELQGSASSDRFILARLNTISFFFTMMQLAAAAWLATVLFWISGEGATGSFSPHLWNCNGAVFSVGLIGAIIMLMCCCTVRIIKEVDLMGAIRYLWFMLWIFPIEIFFNITLFDYHRVTEVWVVHWWTSGQLSWFRNKFCMEGTAESLCLVPISGGPDYETEDDWCQVNYNSTDCTDTRDEAQKSTTFWLLIFYTSLAGWGCIFMFMMLLVVNTLERIISKPIVQKSRETNVPGWLTFPTIATALVGSVFLFGQGSILRVLDSQKWVGILYMIASGLFLIALLMGWCLSSYSIRSNADKRRKGTAIIIFILVLAINASLLATLFVTSIVWSTRVALNDAQRGNIACLIDDNDCTNCETDLSRNKCPEWSVDDVTAILQTQLKQSATLAAIFILYAVNVMSYGINLRKHLSQYQIDYV